MKVIGIIMNVLATLWAGLGLLVMLIPDEDYTPLEDFIGSSIFFYVPALIVIVIGSFIIRAANLNRAKEEEFRSNAAYNRRLSEARADYDQATGYRGPSSRNEPRRESEFAPPNPPGSYTSDGSAYDSGSSGRPMRPNQAPIVEATCRSCGARKTLRAGTSVECEYCGSTITAD
ncbi:hypothetical protein [Saccharibacillus sacchari]|uniref:Uncharacterized protein n=1 Tax=Saccharibacillus sacchari TaxID=456493 RepID=A0ACC6P6C7_9BACL